MTQSDRDDPQAVGIPSSSADLVEVALRHSRRLLAEAVELREQERAEPRVVPGP